MRTEPNPLEPRSRGRRLAVSAICATGLVGRSSLGREERPKLIGVLHSSDPAVENWSQEYLEAGLTAHGWTAGKDYRIERRAGYSEPAGIAKSAQALVELRPDLLFTGSNAGAIPLHRLTTTIPIVAAFLHDPVGMGLARSMARPQGNVTGVASNPGTGFNAKRIQLLHECVPKARHFTALWAASDSSPIYGGEMIDAARELGLALDIVEARNGASFPPAFERIASRSTDGLVIVGVGTITQQMTAICRFALQHRLPAIHAIREFTQAGLLMGYGHNIADNYRRAVALAIRVLDGARPGELAIEHPVRFELTLNARTAHAIGITIPRSLLQRADVVYE